MINEKDPNQWNKTRSQIKDKFSKLSDKQLDSLNGHMDKLTHMVEDTYNYKHSKAVEECKPFTDQSGMTK